LIFTTSSHAQTLAEALDTTNNTSLAWTSGGTSSWTGQTTPAYDGRDAAQSGTITHNQETWIQTITTNGPGTVTFWWKVASLAPDGLEFSINGVEQETISGDVDWSFRSFDVPAGTNILKWRYYKNPTLNGAPDRGWVDQVTYTTLAPLAHQDALNTCGVLWTSGGNTNSTYWNGQTNVTHDGSKAVQSGAIYHNQESWLETTVSGVTNVTFWWKVSSESGFDMLEFYRDSNVQTSISGEIAWQQKSYSLTTNTHTLRWRYFKDDGVTAGLDRAWLDQVVFSPPLRALPYGLTDLKPLSGGRFQFTVTGEVGCACSVQVSTNLSNWIGFSNFTTTSASQQMIDSGASNSVARYYRANSP
jgi:hypothetical protein